LKYQWTPQQVRGDSIGGRSQVCHPHSKLVTPHLLRGLVIKNSKQNIS
jgi:hypothetical protein